MQQNIYTLHFRYIFPNQQVKILTLLLCIEVSDSRQLHMFTFIKAIKADIIMNFMSLQHECVKWERITYPTKKNNKLDILILKLPLVDMIGQVKCEAEEPNLHILNMSIIF
uniref:Uncharacterized protein n=1 Tax=Lophocladia kuetzingii TaxID=675577 RepID=A0A1Z1MNL8_9FLOR|nr:hypothetical protein [Lophocladia kuetzingii]ARW67690.1 hypothetical protein [Lophocladia kuetzingii]